ncbi:MAG TPA: type I DNA topoisomerase, partial [Cyanophyceae cyanobacterium]
MSKLLVIESPGKLSKLKSILGAGWTVKASIGHVRELADEGEDNLGFELTGSRVNCHYVPRDSRSKKVLSELRAAVKASSQVYLATDPDREGETISWHLADELKLKNPLRVTYTEITPAAVKQAIAHPRPLDQNLVAAGRARDCLDKLVGYRGSPLVWPLGAKSVGRVQSATLRLICLREQEIETFVPETYYSVWVEYVEGFKAFYKRSLESKRSKPSAEDDWIDDTAKSTDKTTPESDRVKDKAEAEQLVAIARSHPHHIVKVERKTASIKPPAPFTTSTLQQAAGSRLSLSPERTMQLAQHLYEQGHITYMRTDSVVLSEDFCAAVERYLKQHDPDNVPKKVAKHRGSKNAQEAHEAIRPTHVEQTPSQLAHQLGSPEAKLYELIWNRTVASLCAPAIVEKTKVITQSGSAYWQAFGQVVKFPGYTVYWNNLSADKQLPILSEGQKLTLKDAAADEKQTTPPPRYTEPKLVQKMERLGIGRPSTYSPTIKTLKAREYIQLTKGKLSPTQLGRDVNAFLEKALPDLVDAQFTAVMEEQLDAIASGKQNWEAYLNNWNRDYFAPAITKAKGLVPTSAARQSKTQAIKVESSGVNCPNCG